MKMPNIEIRSEILKHGAISFSRFMELALYCPDSGYYETKKDIGKRGDFYTSVSVGNLFGEMLAFQFAEWLDGFQSANSQFQIVEAGAHNGQLAKDILTSLQANRPDLFAHIEYVILEPSSRRKSWQKETLREFSNVHWLERFNHPSIQPFNGIIFGNELLDAFPIQRFGWNAKDKNWFEWEVTLEKDAFIWTKTPHSILRTPHSELPSSILNLPSPLLEVLPDNYTVEVSPAAENWWRDAANALQHGKLMAIDYGYTADEQFSPARLHGTLRAYFNHRLADDVLANVGEQDLTAHVNFSAIQKVGEDAGLKTDFFSSQTRFLTQILQKTTANKSFDWNNSRARQFQTLTHPNHLGRAFQVLIQSRD